ncbi:MAG: ROK family protein [Calditrichia bacterium]
MGKELAIGIDIGGTAIKYGLCTEDGEIIATDQVKTYADAPPEKILAQIEELCQRALKTAGNDKESVAAIGLGTPGSVDVKRGYLMGSTPNFKHWRDVAIGEYLRERFQLPVVVDNDANMMAYGEYTFGAGKGAENVVCLTLGTGIGGGIIINGQLYRGSAYAGAEIGHMTIDYKGKSCPCGGTGCWERYASAAAIVREYNELNPKNPLTSTLTLMQRFENEEEVAQQVVNNAIIYLGSGIASIINIFNPERIIIGGGLGQAGGWFIQAIEKEAQQRAMKPSQKGVKVLAAKLGNKAGLLGAAALALSQKVAMEL